MWFFAQSLSPFLDSPLSLASAHTVWKPDNVRNANAPLRRFLLAHAGAVLFQIRHIFRVHLCPEHRRELRRRPELCGAFVFRLFFAQHGLRLGLGHTRRGLLPLELFDALLQMVEGRLELIDARFEICALRPERGDDEYQKGC